MYKYLLSEYERTKFPYISLNEMIIKGVFNREEARKLYDEGKIKVHDGMHGKLIRLVI